MKFLKVLIALLMAVSLPVSQNTQAYFEKTTQLTYTPYLLQGDASWHVVFNPSGTQIKDGQLYIRLDFFPPIGSKTYAQQWVSDDNVTWHLNPSLCHFVAVPENIKLTDLQDWVVKEFSPDNLATLDDILSRPDSAHYVSPFMRNKFLSKSAVQTLDKVGLVDSVNAMLSGKQIDLSGGGKISQVMPQSIDVGPGANNEASATSASDVTIIDHENAANANGTLDTWETWFATNGTGVEFATFYVVSGNNFSTRDSESIGNVASGSKQTFTGLSTSVETGDYAGIHKATGTVEKNITTGEDYWYRASDNIPCTNTAFTRDTGAHDYVALYATGTETSVGFTPQVEIW